MNFGARSSRVSQANLGLSSGHKLSGMSAVFWVC